MKFGERNFGNERSPKRGLAVAVWAGRGALWLPDRQATAVRSPWALGGGPSRTGPNHGVTDVRFSSYSWCPAVHLSRSHGESGRPAVRWRQHCGQNWPWPPAPLISSLGLDHHPSHRLGCSGRQHQGGRLRAPFRRCMIGRQIHDGNCWFANLALQLSRRTYNNGAHGVSDY